MKVNGLRERESILIPVIPYVHPAMPTRSRLRRLAAYVLLAWLFALASGIVNACVLGEAHDCAAAMSHANGHAGVAMHDHGAHQHPGEPPCELLCDAPAAARTAGNELGSALAGLWLTPAPLPSVAVRLLPLHSEPAPPAEVPRRLAVPLPIAYARLTL